MALRIYQNVMSLNSQRNLGTSQTHMAKSLERLSSGLRINHAADDASGLAISEKLRGQISGIKRATMNAQDGISMLQTAEGALAEVSVMLQRMRELAIQAANGTYSSNDRVEIQKEVEQLKDEINRISTATEFNTKKLLNGDGTGLWSASSDRISAIIKDRVAEGNYEITLETTPGKNEVFKSEIMTLGDDNLGAEIVTAGGDTNVTNILSVTDPDSLPVTGTAFYTVNISGVTTAAPASISTLGYYGQDGSAFVVDSATIAASGNTTTSGYIEITFDDNFSAADGNSGQIKARFIDAKTGLMGNWQTLDVTYSATNSILHVDSAGTSLASISDGGTGNVKFTFDIELNNSGVINEGDKILFAYTPVVSDGNLITSGGGSIQITNGPSGQDGPTVYFTAANSLTLTSNGDTLVDTNPVELFYASINEQTGNVDIGSMTFNFQEGAATLSDTFDLEILGSGDAAPSTSRIKDLANFVDADGNNLFDNKQELTVWGNGSSQTIYLEGDDTISDVEEKITNALVELGMGSTNQEVNNHLVDYVSIPTVNGGLQSVKGTFVLQTAMTGEQGQISFSGDQALLDGLALSKIQDYENNKTVVTIKDAHNGKLLAREETGDDRIYGVVDGVEIVLDSRAGITETWNSTYNRLDFAENQDASNNKLYLHIVDNSTDLQIGANDGQTLDVNIPQLDVEGLGIENIWLVSQEKAQKAIPDIDSAIEQVVTTRATIGAQINRLEHTINGLQVAEENMTASESRIRDLDVAAEMATFTRYQILNQSGISMLAQANQLPQQVLSLLQ